MRHRKKHLKIGTSRSHRRAILSNLATELIRHRAIKTTEVKAKALAGYVERLITSAKKQTLAGYRHIVSSLKDKEMAKRLFEEASQGLTKNSGWTRILKLAPRHGDNSKMAIISLELEKSLEVTEQTPLQKEKRGT